MKRIVAGVLSAAILAFGTQTMAAEGPALPDFKWSFDGIFGKFERPALQRGFQVYREVCSACHSLRLVAFRDLADLGYDVEQIKAFAAEATVVDGPDDEGEMFERDGRPADRIPSPFPNAKAAAAANGGSAPPDLSLMAKARPHGPSFIQALLTGYESLVSQDVLQSIFESETRKREEKYKSALEEYEEKLEAYNEMIEKGKQAKRPTPPEEPKPVRSIENLGLSETLNFNAFFPGYAIAMAPPLDVDAVEYQDNTEASVDQMSADVAQFLMWTAEPKLEQRKQTGIKVVLFLLVLTGILYAVKRKIWADLH